MNHARWLVVCALLASGAGCSTLRRPASDPPRPAGMSREEHRRMLAGAAEQAPAGAGEEAAFRGEPVAPPAEVERTLPSVTAADPASLSPGLVSNFVVSVWMKYREPPTAAQGFAAIIGKYDPLDAASSEWLIGLGSDKKVFLSTTGSGSPAKVLSTRTIASNQWVHIVGDWRRDGRTTLYLNGKQEAVATLQASPTGSLPLLIGDVNPADGSRLLLGSVDDVRIYARAASAAFATNLYKAAPDFDKDGIRDGDDPDDNNDKISDEWAYENFGDRLAGSPYEDPDADRFLNWQEYVGGSDPNDPASVFRAAHILRTNPVARELVVRCDGVAGRRYRVYFSSNVVARPQRWVAMGPSVVCGQTGSFSLAVTNANLPWGFYNVVVSMDGASF